MSSVGNLPVNSKDQPFSAQLEAETLKSAKFDDILVFSRIGDIEIDGQDKTGSKGAFFKASSNGFFKNFFNYKASSKDVIDVFQRAGMSRDDAVRACKNVKELSKSRKLSGLSAYAVREQLTNLHRSTGASKNP